jgi:hypothetical protein
MNLPPRPGPRGRVTEKIIIPPPAQPGAMGTAGGVHVAVLVASELCQVGREPDSGSLCSTKGHPASAQRGGVEWWKGRASRVRS